MILLDEQLSREPAQLATLDESISIIKKLELELTNSKTPGIGLAAPQIGIDKAVAIIRITNPFDISNHHFINLVNPKLVYAEDLIEFNEGCLSFPGACVKTIRYKNIVIETNSDYEYYAQHIHAKRYNTELDKDMPPLLSNERRKIEIASSHIDHPKMQELSQLLSICVQHEFAHLLGLTMFDFNPIELGRNDKCPCDFQKKNKKCHNYTHYNNNLKKLFTPNYRSL